MSGLFWGAASVRYAGFSCSVSAFALIMPYSIFRSGDEFGTSYRQPLYMNFELVVDANSIDAVCIHSDLRRRVHDRAVDDVLDLVGADAHLEIVRRFPGSIRLGHNIARRSRRDILGLRVAGAAFD